MPLFRDSRPDEPLIRYLLGALPDAETERLDEQSLADDDFADKLKLAEDDLIDAYVSGTLTCDLRERFESHYLASPRRRDKVAFARRFLAAVDRTSSQLHAVAPAPAVREPSRAWTFRLALAAAAVLVIMSSVLLTTDARLRRDLRQAESHTADAQSHVNALAARLQDAQKAANLAKQTRADAPAPEPGGGVALVLPPQTRGVGPEPIVAVESAGVSITLGLQSGRRDGDAYAAALRDPATNRIIWRGAGTPSRRILDLVTVRVPAAVLHAQHYVIELSSSHAGGVPAFVNSYAFEVVR
jgi:hypothetical protein